MWANTSLHFIVVGYLKSFKKILVQQSSICYYMVIMLNTSRIIHCLAIDINLIAFDLKSISRQSHATFYIVISPIYWAIMNLSKLLRMLIYSSTTQAINKLAKLIF